MRTTLAVLLALSLLAACGRSRSDRAQAASDYEVIQEGSAAGVTSTLQGPGEVMPPVTGTNADTTTAFSFDPNAATAAAPTPALAAAPPPAEEYGFGAAPMTSSVPQRSTPVAAQPRPAPVETRPVPAPVEPVPADETAPAETGIAESGEAEEVLEEEPPPADEEPEPEPEPPPPGR